MRVIFVNEKNNEIVELKQFTWKPYGGEIFTDENGKVWIVGEISIDLSNAKMFIYIRES